MKRVKTPASTKPTTAAADVAPVTSAIEHPSSTTLPATDAELLAAGENPTADNVIVDRPVAVAADVAAVDRPAPVETSEPVVLGKDGDLHAPNFEPGIDIDVLRPVDEATAVAAALVEGTPNPDLVEAVRQVLATRLEDGTIPLLKPMEPIAALDTYDAFTPDYPEGLRLGHVALMDLDMDGQSYEPFDTVYVTFDEFGPLRDAQVFAGAWIDGVEK